MTTARLVPRFVTVAWFTGAIGFFAPLASIAADTGGNTEAPDGWQFKTEVYAWLPTIEGSLSTGEDIKLSLDDIFDNLDMTFLGVFQARRGDWAVIADVAYLKLSADEAANTTIPVGPVDIPTEVDIGVELTGWFANLGGAYRVYQADKFDVQVLAGARYLSLDVEATLDASLIPGEKLVSGDQDVWDAVVGVRGLGELGDKWWLSYRFDIGTGESNLTWNASAQFGRRFGWGSLAFGYRYIHYDFDSNFKLLKDLDTYGPVIGAAWEF